MKLGWYWVSSSERELRYSVDGGRTWFTVGTLNERPLDATAAVPTPTRKPRGLGPMGAKILDDAQAHMVRKPRAKAPLRSKR